MPRRTSDPYRILRIAELQCEIDNKIKTLLNKDYNDYGLHSDFLELSEILNEPYRLKKKQ